MVERSQLFTRGCTFVFTQLLTPRPWRKKGFSKKVSQILVDKHIQEQQQQDKEKEEGFTIISLDELFFFYDSLVKRVWIEQDKRPIVRITGSHKHSCIFGAMSLDGKHLFR